MTGRCVSVSAAAVCMAVILMATPAWAHITWTWSFQSESGTFVTDGALAGGFAPAGSYVADPGSLAVISSTVGMLIGASFSQSQTPQGFLWDGVGPTQFWREGGVYTNGMNFDDGVSGYWYGFNTASTFLKDHDQDEALIVEGPLTLQPLSTVLIPVPASIGLVVAGLVSLRQLRRRP